MWTHARISKTVGNLHVFSHLGSFDIAPIFWDGLGFGRVSFQKHTLRIDRSGTLPETKIIAPEKKDATKATILKRWCYVSFRKGMFP